jgi:cytochrome c1
MIPAPTRFSDYEAMRSRRDSEWILAIQSGVSGTAMYAQRLTMAEIQDLIAYLRTLGRRKIENPAPAPRNSQK